MSRNKILENLSLEDIEKLREDKLKMEEEIPSFAYSRIKND